MLARHQTLCWATGVAPAVCLFGAARSAKKPDMRLVGVGCMGWAESCEERGGEERNGKGGPGGSVPHAAWH